RVGASSTTIPPHDAAVVIVVDSGRLSSRAVRVLPPGCPSRRHPLEKKARLELKSTAWILATSVALCAIVMSVDSRAQTRDTPALLRTIDHLVYATPDLAAGVRHIEAVLGIQASPGGQHPRQGTRNALLALGPTSYLEIIGPDPDQPKPPPPRKFEIHDLKEPPLVTWAAKGTNLA